MVLAILLGGVGLFVLWRLADWYLLGDTMRESRRRSGPPEHRLSDEEMEATVRSVEEFARSTSPAVTPETPGSAPAK